MVQAVKNPPAMQETWVQSLGQEDPLQKGTGIHSSILAWNIPWTEEFSGQSIPWTGALQSMGSQKESDMTEQLSMRAYPYSGGSYSFLLNSPCWVNHLVSLDYNYFICKTMTKPNQLCCYED